MWQNEFSVPNPLKLVKMYNSNRLNMQIHNAYWELKITGDPLLPQK
jgi:hypothetical protein